MFSSGKLLKRRRFITLNSILIAGSACGARYLNAMEQTVKKLSDTMRVIAGFTGPKYYDDSEREFLQAVLKSRYPFRFKGHADTHVSRFEKEFASYLGSNFALAVTSGTAALNCAMAALGVGPGDEVIVPACTWWSDYTTVIHAGALPVFADIDHSLNIDPKDIERKITPRTKAIIAVHLLGSACDMDAILSLAMKYQIRVVEDCAQSPGASYQDQKLGTLGDIGIFSFNIYKLMTSGEGGALVTNNKELYWQAARYHDMGTLHRAFDDDAWYNQPPQLPGENYRMNEFTGAVLLGQLPKLDTMITDLRKRKQAILAGISKLTNFGFRSYADEVGETGAYIHLKLPGASQRDSWLQELKKRLLPVGHISGSVILPIQESVMEKRTRHEKWPSFSSEAGQRIVYGTESCRQTITIHDQFIQLNVGADFSSTEIEYIITSIKEIDSLNLGS